MVDKMTLKIDRGVPSPTRRGGWKELAKKMKAGDSVAVEKLCHAVCLITAIRMQGFKAKQQKQDDGTIRVWALG